MKSRTSLENKSEKLLNEIEERFKFFAQIGVDFITQESPLLSLEEEILNCRKCPLAETRQKAVPGEGQTKTELMFVGEAPGRDEDIQGRPFVGRAGQLLTKIINAMDFSREEVYITNIVKCRPPDNRNPHADEMDCCRDYLLRQIAIIQPKVIVTLGKVAAGFFIQSDLGMTALRGEFRDFQGIKVMPTFHPSYLIRNEGNKILRKMVWDDMQQVMVFLGKK
jgi:uracil-DNA glycosylase family 4